MIHVMICYDCTVTLKWFALLSRCICVDVLVITYVIMRVVGRRFEVWGVFMQGGWGMGGGRREGGSDGLLLQTIIVLPGIPPLLVLEIVNL